MRFLYKSFDELSLVIFASIFYWTTLLFIKNIEKFLLYLVLFLLPFNRFLILRSDQAYLLGRISDYLLVTVQLFEIPLFTLILWKGLMFFRNIKKVNKDLILSREILRLLIPSALIFFYIIICLVNKTNIFLSITGLNLLADFLLISWLFRKFGINNFKTVFYISATIQSLISILQVSLNHSVGLYFIGESKFNEGLYYISKTIMSGALRVRAYGTFPHPNLLAAFLFLVIIILIYDLLTETFAKQRFIASFRYVQKVVLLALALLSLYLTQSRTVIFALIISLIFFIIAFLFKKTRNKRIWLLTLSGIFALSGCIIIIFRERIASLFTYDRTSINDRLELAKVSIDSIKNSSFFGNGYGGYLRNLSKSGPIRTMQSFILEPVHNAFLLLTVDFGIIGIISLLIMLGSKIITVFKSKISFPYSFIQISVLCFLLLSLNLDHYLVTLKQGIVLFAILLILLK